MTRRTLALLGHSAIPALAFGLFLAAHPLGDAAASERQPRVPEKVKLVPAQPSVRVLAQPQSPPRPPVAGGLAATNTPGTAADLTPWEKFCFKIHGDDFTPDGYARCVQGLPD